jgi:histidinol-phosphate/aromatic aminotransferase/cobyric acid decarboxylase-like protein
MVKLDAMENPHRLSAELQAQLGARLGAVAVNRYPGQRIDDLKQAIAAHTGMPEGYGLVLGNGSDELISLAFHGLSNARRERTGARARLCHVRHERQTPRTDIHTCGIAGRFRA